MVQTGNISRRSPLAPRRWPISARGTSHLHHRDFRVLCQCNHPTATTSLLWTDGVHRLFTNSRRDWYTAIRRPLISSIAGGSSLASYSFYLCLPHRQVRSNWRKRPSRLSNATYIHHPGHLPLLSGLGLVWPRCPSIDLTFRLIRSFSFPSHLPPVIA